jgi:uncharacterized Zn-binding protein involved in type VI secretion
MGAVFLPAAMNKYFSLVIWSVVLLVACGGSPNASLSVSGSPTSTLSAPSISFGNQVVGTTSSGQVITLSNTGSAELRITGMAVALPFSQTSTCGSSLATGATCTIAVTFDPATEGDFTSNFSITDNAKGSPQRVALSGTGVAQPPPCITIGESCFGPAGPHCCAAPFPHHAYCSNSTGWGTCTMN